MPNPKDYMDDGHQYVRGYVRRKHATDSTAEPHPRLAWYWHLLIGFGITTVIAIVVTRNPLILLGVLVGVSVISYIVN